MTLTDRLLTKKYTWLKITILAIVIFLIILINIFTVLYFHKSISNAIFDIASSLILTCFFMAFVFYIIDKKEKQKEMQIEQLAEAYQYIGQINRKIDALLELDIASLDHSARRPIHETASAIFKQLISLLQAKTGLLYLKPPIEFKIYANGHKDHGLKNALEILARSNPREFRHSQGPDNEMFFKDLGLSDDLLKKYDFVIKPIYMHQQDIGLMLLLFKKNQLLEDRDLNIIRVFSFYLALNATFKPDFSNYQT